MNGREQDERFFFASAYVAQEDNLIPTNTVPASVGRKTRPTTELHLHASRSGIAVCIFLSRVKGSEFGAWAWVSACISVGLLSVLYTICSAHSKKANYLILIVQVRETVEFYAELTMPRSTPLAMRRWATFRVSPLILAHLGASASARRIEGLCACVCVCAFPSCRDHASRLNSCLLPVNDANILCTFAFNMAVTCSCLGVAWAARITA